MGDQQTHLFHKLWEILQPSHGNPSKIITKDEFESHLESPEMQVYLNSLDLTADEFVTGCVRLTGSAKAVDLAAFMYEYRHDARALRRHRKCVEDTLRSIE